MGIRKNEARSCLEPSTTVVMNADSCYKQRNVYAPEVLFLNSSSAARVQTDHYAGEATKSWREVSWCKCERFVSL